MHQSVGSVGLGHGSSEQIRMGCSGIVVGSSVVKMVRVKL